MFKVKRIETTNKTFRMPLELVKRLELIAQQKNVSMNNLIIQCCEYSLNNLGTEDDPQ